jgi:hypothetical protein
VLSTPNGNPVAVTREPNIPVFRRFSMKVISKCLLVLMVFSAIAVFAAPQQAQGQKALEGVLTSIDANNHMLRVMGTDNKEWVFVYTDETQVSGPDKSVQGLAGKSGTKLRITYRVEQGKNVATDIEVLASEK